MSGENTVSFCILQRKLSIPWRQIATSGPVWGLIIVQIGHDWGLFTIITDLPKYMKSVLQFTVVEVHMRTGCIL